MALYDTPIGGGFGTASAGKGILATLVARLRRWQTARATAAELRKLSSSQLADIGIEPGDVDGFAERMARRKG